MEIYRRLLNLFDTRERWQLAGVFAAVALTGVLEVVGVVSILPFMALVASPEAALRHPLLAGVYRSLGFGSVQAFLTFTGGAVLALMVFTNAVTAYTTWLILRFSYDKYHALSHRLLAKYLFQPYTYFLTHNTSSLAKNILTETQTVVEGVVVPALTVLARALVALMLVALLFVYDPLLALSIAGVLGGAYALIFAVYRNRVVRTGQARVRENEVRFRVAAEALGGIKDVKVLDREGEFLDRFAGPSFRFSRHVATGYAVAQLPRYALDSLAFGGVLLIVLYLIAVRGDAAGVIPAMSLYAVAGYRLLPTLQSVFHGLARVRFCAPALDDMYEDLRTAGAAPGRTAPSAVPAAPLAFARGIEVRDLSFRYPGAPARALRGVSLHIPRNHSVALVGSTGSGKTTLVDVVLGLLQPEDGGILVDGVPVTERTLPGWKRLLGYVPQQIFLSDDTIARNIAFGLPDGQVDRAAVERAARIAHLDQFVSTLPDGYDTVVGERGVRLSGGQRQRIGIARALYHDPEVLIMDEATSALDGVTEDAVMQAIQDLSHRKTIVLIAHRLRTVRHCDRIYLLEHGEVVSQGTYDELMRGSAHFRAMALAAGRDGGAEREDALLAG